MTLTASPRSASIRADLDFPVVDGDGHWLEFMPVLEDFLREYAGSDFAERVMSSPPMSRGRSAELGDWTQGSIEQRRDMWIPKGLWWTFPARNSLDRATAYLPDLMAGRLEEMGIDVSVLYPTMGLHMVSLDDELRATACRAFNSFTMEQLHPYPDRLIPVAVIPMCSPEEAVTELEHAVKVLGFRAAVFQHFATRSIPYVTREYPNVAGLLQRPDWYGIDSQYDYDPVWAKCVELGVAATFHGIGNGNGTGSVMRGSISNQVFNRVGMLANLNHRLAAALFLGGVTRRFPTLNLAFLEGGVAWAVTLIADLVGLWGKRNVAALPHLDPANLDREMLFDLVDEHGSPRIRRRLDIVRASFERDRTMPPADEVDEFAALSIQSPSELCDLFIRRLYFGCEGDDRMNALAFRSEMLPFGATLNAFYGSDISHWDVPHMSKALEEAYEPVEDGAISLDQFRELVFVNPVRLHGEMNPNFFAGTRVEAAARELLLSLPRPATPPEGADVNGRE